MMCAQPGDGVDQHADVAARMEIADVQDGWPPAMDGAAGRERCAIDAGRKASLTPSGTT